MNPEVILENQSDIEALLAAMHRFASRVLVSNERRDTLIAAGIPLDLDSTTRPVSFAQSLIAEFLQRPVSERGAQDHSMVRLLQYFLNRQDPSSYGLTDDDLRLFERLVAEAHERAGALKARRSVGKIEDARRRGLGTGVVVGAGLLLTCQHVIGKTGATQAWVRFDYTTYASGRDPRALFELDLQSHVDVGGGGLDYILLRIKGRPARAAHTSVQTVLNSGDEIRLIHHPQGQPAAVSDVGHVVHVAQDYLLHDIPTEEGSSGAPIFNRDWELVALHRGYSARVERGTTEGVPVRAFWDTIQPHISLTDTL